MCKQLSKGKAVTIVLYGEFSTWTTLHCIIRTGYYLFLNPDTGNCVMELMLKYTPSTILQSPPPLHQPSSLENLEAVSQQMEVFQCTLSRTELQKQHETKVTQLGSLEYWRRDQINDFVLKLGFLNTGRDIEKDRDTENRDKIRDFLHVTEVCM